MAKQLLWGPLPSDSQQEGSRNFLENKKAKWLVCRELHNALVKTETHTGRHRHMSTLIKVCDIEGDEYWIPLSEDMSTLYLCI